MKYEKYIKVDFTEETEYGVFCDSLKFNKDPTEQEIEDLVKVRVANHIESIKNAPVYIETKEDVERNIASMEEDLAKHRETLATFGVMK